MTLRERTREYIKSHHLSRRAIAEVIEAALAAYFLKLDNAQARAQRPEFMETMTAKIILEKCQEADERRELALLYGPPGIGKTFAIEEFMERMEKRDNLDQPEVLFVTAHSASTPKSLMSALCLRAGVPHQGTASTLAESLVRKLETGRYLIM